MRLYNVLKGFTAIVKCNFTQLYDEVKLRKFGPLSGLTDCRKDAFRKYRLYVSFTVALRNSKSAVSCCVIIMYFLCKLVSRKVLCNRQEP